MKPNPLFFSYNGRQGHLLTFPGSFTEPTGQSPLNNGIVKAFLFFTMVLGTLKSLGKVGRSRNVFGTTAGREGSEIYSLHM